MAAFSSALLFHATRLSPVVLLLLLSCSVEANVQDSELYFMFIAPSTARFNTSASRQAVELALQHINSDGHVLPGYSLSLASGESNCDAGTALSAFFTGLKEPPHEVAVIGAGCSMATEAVARVSHYYNITMISYASSTEVLDPDSGSSDLYPYHFSTVPSDSYTVLGVRAMVSHFGWSRVSIIAQDQPEFRKSADNLFTQFEGLNVTVHPVLLSTKITRIKLFAPDVRIFVLFMQSDYARFIMCQAISQLSLLDNSHLQYVWITPGHFMEAWWQGISSVSLNDTCSGEEIEEFLSRQRVIAISHYPVADTPTQPSISGITPEEFVSAVSSNSSADASTLYAYDAVWALALALNRTTEVLDSCQPLEGCSAVGNSPQWRAVGEAIRNSTQETMFEGVSGRVAFDDHGSRKLDRIRVFQYRNNSVFGNLTLHEVASISLKFGADNLALEFAENESNLSLWGMIPSDGAPLSAEHYPLLWLATLSYVYSGVLLVLAMVCAAFNFAFRKRKLIRLTSPNLNYLIVIGVISLSCSVFFYIYPPISTYTLEIFCGLRPWLSAIGYSLCFGTINTKMWRVYYIFHNPKPSSKKKPLKDWALFSCVMLFVSVDVVIMVIVTGFSGTRLQPVQVPDKEFPSGFNLAGVRVEYYVQLCEAPYRTAWLVVLFGYKAVLQIIGVILAFRIRNVKIKVLNDSKEVVITLYVTSAVLATIILISLVLSDHLNVYNACYSLGIPVACTVVLCVVFFSKMVRLYKDPKGDKLFADMNRNMNSSESVRRTGTTAITALEDHTLKIQSLEKQVATLSSKLKVYKKQTSDTDVDRPATFK